MQCRSSWSYDDKKLAWPAPSLGPRPPHTRLSSCSLVLATLHCIATLHPTLGLLASHTKLSRAVLHFTLFNSRVLRAFLVFPCPTIKTGGSCSANALLQYPGGSYNTQFDFHAHSQQIVSDRYLEEVSPLEGVLLLFPNVVIIVATWQICDHCFWAV